ncbi:DUF433 domain-containing protein [Anabaena aphanizomenioides LEGE 00250]|uniref:DUF433 domain-containing protein n=1 Tax=Sphaerospermopsis aphanizomenoides LEGE 00250 TaxID=2777972 RepID=A0ABR9VI01_9CYAN|nr:DUF433 domain-containing protein [Sphaerospermopsis aphanizomenoides]MBE9238128.1 DUF433 domain-containing protein [Sphaerospermopsis aphanizomenoides LEGE 00250]
MFAETSSRYVKRNPEILGGEPIITGTRTSIRAIVGLWRLGIMPEEIPNHLPYLTLAQVFDALSFYLDHQAEINDYIERNQVPNELVHPAVKATRKDHPLAKFTGILSDAEAADIKQSIAQCRRVNANEW